MATAEHQDTLLGKKIGNFVIEKKLGEGGMGAVYLAVHPFLRTKVAVKVLSRRILGSPDAMARFRNEALTVARLRHESIVTVSDFGELDDKTPYIVMEYMQGQELTGLLRDRGPMPAGEVLKLLEPISGALQAAHEHGVVHRDLKPDNIFVLSRDPPRLKLLDFGIAKLLEGEDGPGLTASGMILGTPFYLSPEQGMGKVDQIGPWSDIYSLGVILYQMLCGHTPFEEPSFALQIAAHVREQPPALVKQAPQVPEAVAEVVHLCLAKSPEERPSTAAELLERFRSGLNASTTCRLVAGALAQGDGNGATHKGIGEGKNPAAMATTALVSETGQVAQLGDIAELSNVTQPQENPLPAESFATRPGPAVTTVGTSSGQLGPVPGGQSDRRIRSVVAGVLLTGLCALAVLVYVLAPGGPDVGETSAAGKAPATKDQPAAGPRPVSLPLTAAAPGADSGPSLPDATLARITPGAASSVAGGKHKSASHKTGPAQPGKIRSRDRDHHAGSARRRGATRRSSAPASAPVK
ncbi:MAG: protein kinase, partial [Oligoflexia bacterium]|nr:protein kinase [Oligoflexia bacterium]